MDRIIQSPGKYIQGAGAIKRLGDYLKPLAERWLVVGDKFVLGFAEEMLRKSLADAGLAAEIAPFGGECSHNEINRLRDIAGNAKCTAVLGIGGGKTLDTAKALALAELCYNTLVEEGEKAMLAAEQHVVTPALERVIEANTYLSGVGFESGGLAAAHAIHNGLTAIPDAHHFYHGEKVAFGTLTQLVLENAPVEEIETAAALCHSVGLPITLAQLDIKGDIPAKMRMVAEAACAEGETIHNMPGGACADQVYAALLVADQYGQRFLQEWE